MDNKEPDINISETEITNAGFTLSGRDQFKKTVKDYSKTLFAKAIIFADVDKADVREVTHDHIKSAAYTIANSFGKPTKPRWMIYVKFGQYVCAIGIGIASTYLDKLPGTIGFIAAFIIGSILFYVENNK